MWPTDLGLAHGYSGVGDNKKALEYAQKALVTAPDEGNRKNIQGFIERLEKGEKIN